MVDFRRGIIAGVAAAAVFLIISVILEVTGLADRFPDFVASAGLIFWFDPAEPWHMVPQLIAWLARGAIFGAVFAALCSYLPGWTAVWKAMVVSLMIWAIGVIQSMYISLRWPWQADGAFPETASYGTAVNIHILGGMLISIASAVAFGALAGAIWSRLKDREAPEPRPGSGALLIGFAIGIWGWLGAAAVVILGVFVSGWVRELSSITPMMWTMGIAYTPAAVFGLVGWILVLLGWRRTRKGETGFRRGLAGGMVMAFTGVMLLPGVVSIIGAVLSRREPASEQAMSTQLG